MTDKEKERIIFAAHRLGAHLGSKIANYVVDQTDYVVCKICVEEGKELYMNLKDIKKFFGEIS